MLKVCWFWLVFCKYGDRGWNHCWSPASAFALGAAGAPDWSQGDAGGGWAGLEVGSHLEGLVTASAAENWAASKWLYTSRCFCGDSKRLCVHQHLFCFLYLGLTSLSQETMQGKSVCFLNSASINLILQSCSGLYKDLLIKTFAKYWLWAYAVRPERSSAK